MDFADHLDRIPVLLVSANEYARDVELTQGVLQCR